MVQPAKIAGEDGWSDEDGIHGCGSESGIDGDGKCGAGEWTNGLMD
jgi:hypothetical protein